MKNFRELKVEIRNETDSTFKYGRFLDELANYDRRSQDESWDLWYFSLNTDFCLASAKHFLEDIEEQCNGYAGITTSGFSFDEARRLLGCLCFYLYAALDSFAHEINIFYEINLDRSVVSLKRIAKEVSATREMCSLSSHIQRALSNPDMSLLFEYRHAIMHGYVFPIGGIDNKLFIKEHPRAMKFSFKEIDIDFRSFCVASCAAVDDLITTGWRCFSEDEL